MSVATSNPIRVVVADDHYLVRTGIARVLAAAGVSVVGEAEGPDDLLALAARERPDAAIVDIRMPPTHTDEGVVAARWLRDQHPEIAVIVLSAVVDAGIATRLLADHPHGVGYLLKDRVTDAAALTTALARVRNGECVLDPMVVTLLLNRPRHEDALSRLTPRERDVLALMAEGRDNATIAAELMLGERTIETHVAAVFGKLGLLPGGGSNRRVLAVLAYLGNGPGAGE